MLQVRGATDVVGVEPSPREIGEVEGQEQHHDDPGPTHRAAGEVRHLVVAGRLVLDRTGLAVQHGQRVGGVDVQQQRADEHQAQTPQEDRAGQDRHEDVAEELAVVVDVVHELVAFGDDAEVHLEVADHVPDDEADPDDPGDRHDVLLADCGRVEVADEPLLLRRRLDRGARDGSTAHRLCHWRETTPHRRTEAQSTSALARSSSALDGERFVSEGAPGFTLVGLARSLRRQQP